MSNCPLCPEQTALPYSRDKLRHYLRCPACSLIYVPRDQLISEKDEEARYQAHQNDAADVGYRQYMYQVVQAVSPELEKGMLGLDFGCGRSTLLAELLESGGFGVSSFDLFFHPDRTPLESRYDFILLIEVIEHLRAPLPEMQQLRRMLKPRGKIFLKTKFEPGSLNAFDNWFYKRDSTHVQFFSEQSLNHLAQELMLEKLQIIGEDLVMLRSSN